MHHDHRLQTVLTIDGNYIGISTEIPINALFAFSDRGSTSFSTPDVLQEISSCVEPSWFPFTSSHRKPLQRDRKEAVVVYSI